MKNIDAIKGGQQVIRMLTTKTGTPVVIPLHPIVEEVLKKYDGTLPHISNVKFNAYIKQVAERAGITQTVRLIRSKSGLPIEVVIQKYEAVSSHTGRRSFITNLHIAKVDLHTIKLMSGHKTTSELEKYIKVTLEENVEALFGNPFFRATV